MTRHQRHTILLAAAGTRSPHFSRIQHAKSQTGGLISFRAASIRFWFIDIRLSFFYRYVILPSVNIIAYISLNFIRIHNLKFWFRFVAPELLTRLRTGYAIHDFHCRFFIIYWILFLAFATLDFSLSLLLKFQYHARRFIFHQFPFRFGSKIFVSVSLWSFPQFLIRIDFDNLPFHYSFYDASAKLISYDTGIIHTISMFHYFIYFNDHVGITLISPRN
jgi:hypothetical protein